jgi:hypothetical protein
MITKDALAAQNRHQDVLEEAFAFGNIAPYLSEFEVVEHLNFVFNKQYREGTILATAAMIAYRGHMVEAKAFLIA